MVVHESEHYCIDTHHKSHELKKPQVCLMHGILDTLAFLSLGPRALSQDQARGREGEG